MTEWTEAARQRFDDYCTKARDGLVAGGADPAEVFEDVRGHVEREARAGGLTVVTREDMQRFLEGLGPLGAQAEPGGDPDAGQGVTDFRRERPAPPADDTGRLWPYWVFGVGLPVTAIAVEATSGMCASTFFDPMPTVLHLLLVAAVPAGLAFALVQLQRDLPAGRRVGLAVGFALALSLLYTLPFLPLLPISVFAIVIYGLGILPFAPLLSAITAWRLSRRLKIRLGGGRFGAPGVAAGAVVAFVCLALADFPRAVTGAGLRLASSPDAAASRRGIALLRRLGSERQMLRACYDPSSPRDLFSWLGGLAGSVLGAPAERPLSPDDARGVYWRVTGHAFNSVPPPRLATLRGDDPTEGWDFERGGTQVGALRKGLSLAVSRLDGSVDADSALGYLEWTFEVRNDALTPSEARAQLELPPGGVVSRATLWIGGEPREAAFGPRGVVRQAYEAVVRQQRDPLLVTTSGPDRVLVQCFPVNPGQTMRARLGITAPLVLDSAERGWLALPRLVERNFRLSEGAAHDVWLETKASFDGVPAGYRRETLSPAGEALRGALPASALLGAAGAIAVRRDPRVLEAWTPGLPDGVWIHQRLSSRAGAADAVVVVVDASLQLASSRGAIERALTAATARAPLSLVLAGDEPRAVAPAGAEDVRRELRRAPFEGGVDNAPALALAWDLAARSPQGALVWLHGTQPVATHGLAELQQRWDRRPGGPRLHAVAIGDGRNVILEALDGRPASVWPRRGELESDLEALLSRLTSGGFTAVRRAVRAEPKDAAGGTAIPDAASVPTSAHLARLWARDEVWARLADPRGTAREEAARLAIEHRLVTPVSGAVVLETKAQYDAAGLTPVAASTVPTVPEPETWMLLGVTAAVVLWTLRRKPAWIAA